MVFRMRSFIIVTGLAMLALACTQINGNRAINNNLNASSIADPLAIFTSDTIPKDLLIHVG